MLKLGNVDVEIVTSLVKCMIRAQFGMDNEGNYRQQSLTNMQKAVYKGELSVVDYYERQVRKSPLNLWLEF